MAVIPLVVFARAPRPGFAKTRLAAALGPEAAARLYRAFLADVLARVTLAPGFAVELSCAGDVDDTDLVALSTRFGVPRVPQPGGDLGERMEKTLRDRVERAGAAAVIGSDLPTLPAPVLGSARRALASEGVVLGPGADGGFYLIGVRGPVPSLAGGRWSTSHALEDTAAAVRAAGRSLELLTPWYDVDTPEDLRLLRAHLRCDPSAAPHTAEVLRPMFARGPDSITIAGTGV